jgi:hypothetical protein
MSSRAKKGVCAICKLGHDESLGRALVQVVQGGDKVFTLCHFKMKAGCFDFYKRCLYWMPLENVLEQMQQQSFKITIFEGIKNLQEGAQPSQPQTVTEACGQIVEARDKCRLLDEKDAKAHWAKENRVKYFGDIPKLKMQKRGTPGETEEQYMFPDTEELQGFRYGELVTFFKLEKACIKLDSKDHFFIGQADMMFDDAVRHSHSDRNTLAIAGPLRQTSHVWKKIEQDGAHVPEDKLRVKPLEARTAWMAAKNPALRSMKSSDHLVPMANGSDTNDGDVHSPSVFSDAITTPTKGSPSDEADKVIRIPLPPSLVNHKQTATKSAPKPAARRNVPLRSSASISVDDDDDVDDNGSVASFRSSGSQATNATGTSSARGGGGGKRGITTDGWKLKLNWDKILQSGPESNFRHHA